MSQTYQTMWLITPPSKPSSFSPFKKRKSGGSSRPSPRRWRGLRRRATLRGTNTSIQRFQRAAGSPRINCAHRTLITYLSRNDIVASKVAPRVTAVARVATRPVAVVVVHRCDYCCCCRIKRTHIRAKHVCRILQLLERAQFLEAVWQCSKV